MFRYNQKVEEKNEQEQAPNSGEYTSQMATIQSQLPDAPFHLPSGSFFCSDNAGAYLKVFITMAQSHKRKKNSAANIYSGFHIGHSVGNRLKFIDGQISQPCDLFLVRVVVDYEWKPDCLDIVI